MQVGMVGLGRMGANMARRLIRGGHEIVGYASDPAAPLGPCRVSRL
jgi:6-phosphogluconate dehydrogenase